VSHIQNIERKGRNGKPVTKYQARWIDPAGDERAKTFDLKRDAQRHNDRMAADMLTGEYADPTSSRMTVRAYAETIWLPSRSWQASTRERIVGTLNRWIYPRFGDRALGSIVRSDVEGYRVALDATELAASTKRNLFFVLTDLLDAAHRDQKVRRNPAEGVEPPANERTEVIIPTTAEVFALAEATPDRYRAATWLAAGDGLRGGEVFGLAEDMVTFGTGGPARARRLAVVGAPASESVVSVTRQRAEVARSGAFLKAPKSKAGIRDLPQPARVVESLTAHLRDFPPTEVTLPWGRPDGAPVTVRLVFTDEDGQPITRKAWSGIWRDIATRAGCPGVDFHHLRHFAVSGLIRHGATLEEVRVFAGHSDARTTYQTYMHLWEDSPARTLSALDAALDFGTTATAREATS
jgi:integrase